ncbi:molybdopterin-dependent oxidoreductase [Desulfofustis glycolicus]|uniref:Thiosulfate reductase / polysulfide reductase chain A n=1 Tax=Desulfofustis glycolicus DSM 9705 TaxID=1121409 RepID=A0A1M5Y224_9BACT|nr:molybdopterin-dependent oxidoreductase [Desulfofustis glycolicus]MCB2217725.1 molybdopterin-dependent oxidoreductase [Desulfobulbaceae bacterium]SHI05864.1 thiosulfate reductase / polysulfide reductase chain A [Desulfofustis glycolicus DSM 9705]
MDVRELNRARGQLYHFLSVMFRDELPAELLAKMGGGAFFDQVLSLQDSCSIQDFCSGLNRLTSFLKTRSADEAWRQLRHDYAELFLNAGKNPAFPYESCYHNREPLVMQEPLAAVRAAYRAAGVHKSETYPDLDDHIAVELEFMRYLADQAASGEDNDQFDFLRNHLMGWSVDFCAVLTSAAPSEFYRGLAEMTMSFLFNERMYSFAAMAEQEASPAYVHILEKMAAAIATLELDPGYALIAEGAAPPAANRSVKTHCYICLGLCGQEVVVKDNVITGCKGLPGDPKGGGRLCIKGANAHNNTYSAYRLKTPLIKENGRFRKAGWDEAMAMIAERLKAMDPETVAFHRGNDFNNWCHEAVMTAYGTPHKTTHRQMCDNPARMANEKCFSEKRPWIDYANSRFILLFGINELATSAGQRKVALLKKAVNDGAKLVVVDPRRCESASLAAEWIPIKPGTDGAMAMAMCYVIVKEELYDRDFVDNWTHGFAEFKKRLLGEEDGIARTPKWAAEICGVPAATIERLAHEFAAAAPHAGANAWTGVAQAPNTVHATQALMSLNALMGCFDAPGGPSLIRKFKLASAWADDQPKPPNNAAKTKLNQGHLWSGWIPAYFEQDVEAGRLKAMVCYFGNPVMSSGSEPAMRRGMEKLEFSCGIDCFLTNTTVLCDVILPDCTYLEQSRVVADWMYESFISLGQKAIEPMYQSRTVVQIFSDLANRLGYGEFFPWQSEEEYLRNQLRNQKVSLEELKQTGFYVTDPQEFYKYKAWGSVNPPAGYGSSGSSASGKYAFINPVAEEKGLDGLPDYKSPYEDWPQLQSDDEFPMLLGYFRVLEHEHTSTYANVALMKQSGTNPVWINFVDAKRLGIGDGDQVEISSPWAVVRAKAKVTWDIRQGVLAAAGGFGGLFGLEGDPKYPHYHGFNTNVLLPPNVACKWSGTPPLKYIKTRVVKA